jgi:folate-binding protein YgfZ
MSWTETVGVRAQADDIVVAIDGDDARTWLNGQLTNDVKKLAPGGSVYGLVLTTKGRILADLLVADGPDGLCVVAPRAAWPALREQLEKYIIMEDVTLRETDLAITTLAGPLAGDPSLAAPGPAWTFRSQRLGPCVEVVCPGPQAEALRARLLDAARALGGGPADDERWELARIREGVPRFAVDFGDRSYPQEAGLKRRALAFDKGCYLGQEVVCMLENRGQVARSLVRLEVEGPTSPGAALVDEAGEVVGEITSTAADGGRTRALGYVKRALAESGRRVRTGEHDATISGVVG